MNGEQQAAGGAAFPVETMMAENSLTLMSVVLAVLKRPWILILSLLLVMVPLIAYVYSMVPEYTSSSIIMVSSSGKSFLDEVANLGGQYTPTQEKPTAYYTSILDSRAFFDQAAKRVMQLNPDMPQDSAASLVRSAIHYATNPRQDGFLSISARAYSAQTAQQLAQIALEEFRNRTIGLDREDAVRVAAFIDDQITHITDELGAAEKQLQDFLSTRNIVVTDPQSGIVGDLLDLEKNLSSAEASAEMNRINIESFSRQLSDMTAKLMTEYNRTTEDAADTIRIKMEELRGRIQDAKTANLSDEQVHSLMNEMERLRQQMVSRIAAPTGGMGNGVPTVGITLQKLEEQIQTALLDKINYQNQVNYYQAQIDQFKKAHPNLPDDILEYARLTRSKDVLQSTLQFMLNNRETARIRVAMEQGGIMVIDEPQLPGGPISRGREKKLAFGLIAALFLGVLVSVVIDRLDSTVREEGDVRRALGVPVFGTIPVLTNEKLTMDGLLLKPFRKRRKEIGGEGRLLTNFDEKSPVAEAYRSLKITLQFAAKDQGKKVFVISSSSASEGKSLTTANIAISFAQGGKRTLIIDGDLRRAMQHRFFGFERKPGLTNYLYEEADARDIIRQSPVPNLFVITAGTSPANPAEMLASQKMRKFLGDLRDQFDIILIDSPPILICADPLVLGESADGIVLVAKVESTSLRSVEHALNQIRRLNIDMMGVILNQIELRFGLTYYYAYRHYRPYTYYGSYAYIYDYDDSTGERVKRRKAEPNNPV